MPTDDPKSLNARWIQAFNQQDWEAERACRTADYQAHVSGVPVPLDAAGWDGFMRTFTTAFPDAKIRIPFASLLTGVARRGGAAGWPLQLAMETLQHLARAQATPAKGMGATELVTRMRVDTLQLLPVLETLVALDWIAPLAEEPANEDPRYVLLADPGRTSLEPLLRELLLPRAPPLDNLWQRGPLRTLLLQDVLACR